MGYAVVVRDLPERTHARLCALLADVHKLVREQPAAASATERLFPDCVRRHVVIVVANGAQNGPRDLELPPRLVAHARGACDIAAVVIGQVSRM